MESREKGFSLIELMVAMVVTLIISGAVFQLVTAGQSAFKKEPAAADRQQNIRMAMDVITQDLYRAGSGAPTFAQVFTDGLDGVGNGEGTTITGSSGEPTDVLQMFSTSRCDPHPVCALPGTGNVSVTVDNQIEDCVHLPGLVLLADDERWAVRWAQNPQVVSACPGAPAGSKNGKLTFPNGKPALVSPTGGFTGWLPSYMLPGEAVRYRINMGADGIPNLERSVYAGQVDLAGKSTWDVVARGIEDLQVQYENSTGWHDGPGNVTCTAPCAGVQADYDKLIRRVRVRLGARVTESGQIAGETTAVGANAVRGQLVTEVAPRPANDALQIFNGTL